jgi:hypothetical protein
MITRLITKAHRGRGIHLKLPRRISQVATPVLIALAIAVGSSSVFAKVPPRTPPAGMTCSGDHIVWVNTRSGIYHFQGERYFAATKQRKFMCQHDADAEGDRPTRNGQ